MIKLMQFFTNFSDPVNQWLSTILQMCCYFFIFGWYWWSCCSWLWCMLNV